MLGYRDTYSLMRIKIFSPMSNPIQTVLAAEQAANREILDARAQAEQAISQARRAAKQLMERTEQRLKRATHRFEQHAEKARDAEVAQIQREAVEQMSSRRGHVDERLADIVAAAFEEHWPSPDD